MSDTDKEVKDHAVIKSVKYWLENTVIGYNFCPFAKREFVKDSIHYEVAHSAETGEMLSLLSSQLELLTEETKIETSLLIFPKGLESFFDYLDFHAMAVDLNSRLGYDGIFQLASFHPDYCFEDSEQNEASNYTNRSPYPMVHILREQSLTTALRNYNNPENIPVENVKSANKVGVEPFEKILNDAIKS